MTSPQRGEVWVVTLDPTRGREQAGRRPALVVSTDRFNQSGAELAVVLAITSKGKGIPWHVAIDPPEGGVKRPSYVMCETIRSVSHERLVTRWGSVSRDTMEVIQTRLQALLGLWS